MYDSRSDADIPRRAWKCKPDVGGEGYWDNRPCLANREMGKGDRIEWNTPRTAVLATRNWERRMITEGIDETVEPTVTFGLFAEIEADALESVVSDTEAGYALATIWAVRDAVWPNGDEDRGCCWDCDGGAYVDVTDACWETVSRWENDWRAAGVRRYEDLFPYAESFYALLCGRI